ncbi:hypothetical protein [Aggregatibacter kilianii]|uniref:hypothetical protein n=1 Tax=Aggregatibacter kilianii TaxID=2025884 RepID=UPI000D657B0B|nr:hypothetical protein [Aggregatibacter kilianii]
MTMTIQGNNNTQVSGNLTENHYHGPQSAEIPLDHPHRVLCPQCNLPTLKFNEYCGNGRCTYGIRLHFAEIERKKLREANRVARVISDRLNNIKFFKIGIVAAAVFVGFYLAKNHIGGLTGHFMAIAGMIMLAGSARAQK